MSDLKQHSTLQHLAIIPDGNRRWAQAHLLLPWQGHTEGIKRFWEITEACKDSGIKYLTFWGGSYSNLAKRSKKEVDVLFKIMADEISKPDLLEKLTKNKTSLEVIGEWEDFARDSNSKQILKEIKEKTIQSAEQHVTILFGYDGQREMLNAVNKLVSNKAVFSNELSGEQLTAQDIQDNLMTAALPEVDFVIRTGGDPHWSAGFLMWQTANSQFYFTDELWPDFKTPQLKTALEDFERRERRMGK